MNAGYYDDEHWNAVKKEQEDIEKYLGKDFLNDLKDKESEDFKDVFVNELQNEIDREMVQRMIEVAKNAVAPTPTTPWSKFKSWLMKKK